MGYSYPTQAGPLAARSHQRRRRDRSCSPADRSCARSTRSAGARDRGGIPRATPSASLLSGVVVLCRERGEMVVHDEAQDGLERIHRRIGAHLASASKISSSPQTSPACAHCSTIASKKRRKTGKPRRARILLSEE